MWFAQIRPPWHDIGHGRLTPPLPLTGPIWWGWGLADSVRRLSRQGTEGGGGVSGLSETLWCEWCVCEGLPPLPPMLDAKGVGCAGSRTSQGGWRMRGSPWGGVRIWFAPVTGCSLGLECCVAVIWRARNDHGRGYLSGLYWTSGGAWPFSRRLLLCHWIEGSWRRTRDVVHPRGVESPVCS